MGWGKEGGVGLSCSGMFPGDVCLFGRGPGVVCLLSHSAGRLISKLDIYMEQEAKDESLNQS